jgi:hypothetical protein
MFWTRSDNRRLPALVLCFCVTVVSADAQHGQPFAPLRNEQRGENAPSLKQELSLIYKRWLDEDVRWIITDEEHKAFNQLSSDQEGDQFIEAFWHAETQLLTPRKTNIKRSTIAA